MKWFFLLVVIVAALAAAGWHFRDQIFAWTKFKVSVESVAAPATPHPATDSRALAIKAYPALGVQGSAFNRKFVELYNGLKDTDPVFLTQPDWPMQLADRTARELGGVVASLPPPVATPPPAPQWGSLLDKKPGVAPGPTVAPSVPLHGIQGSLLDQRPPSRANITPVPH